MMANGWIFGGIGFVVGLIGGAVGFGSLCTREARKKISALEEQNDEMAEEIKELKAELRKKKETKAEKKEREMKSYKEYKDLVEEHGYSAGDEAEEEETPEDETKKKIRIISPEEYREDMDIRETESLTWYKADKILTDVADDRVRGEAGVIGKDALDKLQDEDFDEEFLYVANDIDNVMYEIQVNSEGSWYRDVLGMEV